MVRALLSYSRVDRGGVPHPGVELAKAVAVARGDLSLLEKEVAACVLCDDLPLVHGDLEQLVQVFQNLLSNALKHRPDGVPRVRIGWSKLVDKERLARHDGGFDYAVMEVADNGIGIDQRYSEKIFEIYQRLHSSLEYEGNGIGLALCQKIIRKHRGEIWVSSRLAHGATFDSRRRERLALS